MTILFIAVVSGLVIDLFFRLVKYRDSLNELGPQPRYLDYGYIVFYHSTRYTSVAEFLSGGSRRWGTYILFRLFPPFAILVLTAAIFQRYFDSVSTMPYLLITATVSVIFRDLWMVWGAKLISERLLHLANVLGIYLLTIAITIFASSVDISFIAPSAEGLFDNLWSTLLVAGIVLLYSRITNPYAKEIDERAEKTAKENYVFNSYEKIRNQFYIDIETAAEQYKCSIPTLYAVLIYENMNRPRWIRSIENAIVRVTRKELTVGIAQVKSDKVLTDSESITKAAYILRGSSKFDRGFIEGYINIQQLEDVLKKYNSSRLYTDSIAEIIVILNNYAPIIFPSKSTELTAN